MEASISNFIPITYTTVAQHIEKLKFKSCKNISFTALYFRIDRFLKSLYYVPRKVTHIGQSLPSNSIELCYQFLKK